MSGILPLCCLLITFMMIFKHTDRFCTFNSNMVLDNFFKKKFYKKVVNGYELMFLFIGCYYVVTGYTNILGRNGIEIFCGILSIGFVIFMWGSFCISINNNTAKVIEMTVINKYTTRVSAKKVKDYLELKINGTETIIKYPVITRVYQETRIGNHVIYVGNRFMYRLLFK